MGTYNLNNHMEQPVGLSRDSVWSFNGNSYNTVQLDSAFKNQIVTKYSTATAIAVYGKAVIAGGTGLAMTLAAPVAGCLCDINVLSLASGSVVVTCAAGVTFDGTNNTATFNAAADRLTIGYKSATQWEIFLNNSVTLSAV